MVGIVAHQRGQIESRGEAGLPLGKQIAKTLVGIFGCAKSSKLAHGPKPSAIHGRVNAARVWRFARQAEVPVRIPIAEIGWRVKPADRGPRKRCEFKLALPAIFE